MAEKQAISSNPANSNSTDAKQRKKHARLMTWFEQEMNRQAVNRYQMAIDEDYYDSDQWTAGERATLEQRGQAATVYNETKPTIDWLIGLERRTRTDFNVISMHDESLEADEDAKCKTKLLKYFAEVNRVEFERSQCADDKFKAGVGWMEIGVNPDPEDALIYKRSESWRNMLYDSLGSRRDLEDARYLFRFRMVDLDIAIAYFPKMEQKLRESCVNGDDEKYMEWWNGKPTGETEYAPSMGKYHMYDSDAWSNNRRERVMLIEAWYKDPTNETRGGTSSVDRVRMMMQCTVMTEKHIIMDVPSPYKHNKYPFVPDWAYRRKKDNAPYGPIRPIRGPQDALNKRMSKALFVLSTNQVIAEVGAFDQLAMKPQEVRDELRAADGFVILAKDGLSRIKQNRETDVAQGHLQMADADRTMIRNGSGISSEGLNRDTNITAGIALKQRAEQGGQLTAELFDNSLLARQLEGELTLSLIEQYCDGPMIFSITGDRSKRDYIKINQPDPANPGQKLNDITARKAQFIIGEQAWKQSLQQAAFESLMDLLTKLGPTSPQIVMALLDTVFELADIPNKKVILQRIRTITGMTDPDEPESQENLAAKEEQKALASKQMESQMAQLDAEIQKARSTGSNLDAKSLETTMKALYVAMQAAQVIGQMPTITPVADELLKSAGFVDKNGGAVAAQPAPATSAPEEMAVPTMQPTMEPVQTIEPEPELAPIEEPMLADGAQAGIETMQSADNMEPLQNE